MRVVIGVDGDGPDPEGGHLALALDLRNIASKRSGRDD